MVAQNYTRVGLYKEYVISSNSPKNHVIEWCSCLLFSDRKKVTVAVIYIAVAVIVLLPQQCCGNMWNVEVMTTCCGNEINCVLYALNLYLEVYNRIYIEFRNTEWFIRTETHKT